MEEYPSNSHNKKGGETPSTDEPMLEKIISGEAVVRRPSGFKKLRNTFILGDSRTVSQHVFWELFVPALKNGVVDMGTTFLEMMVHGENRPARGGLFRGGMVVPTQGPGSTSRFNYNGLSASAPKAISQGPANQEVRSSYSPNEIVVGSRVEAEAIIQRLNGVIEKYGAVTTANLYRAVGVSPNYTDDKWGWYNLEGSHARRVSQGYLIVLPTPEELN